MTIPRRYAPYFEEHGVDEFLERNFAVHKTRGKEDLICLYCNRGAVATFFMQATGMAVEDVSLYKNEIGDFYDYVATSHEGEEGSILDEYLKPILVDEIVGALIKQGVVLRDKVEDEDVLIVRGYRRYLRDKAGTAPYKRAANIVRGEIAQAANSVLWSYLHESGTLCYMMSKEDFLQIEKMPGWLKGIKKSDLINASVSI